MVDESQRIFLFLIPFVGQIMSNFRMTLIKVFALNVIRTLKLLIIKRSIAPGHFLLSATANRRYPLWELACDWK